MSLKNYMTYGDAETILSEYASDIKNRISGKNLLVRNIGYLSGRYHTNVFKRISGGDGGVYFEFTINSDLSIKMNIVTPSSYGQELIVGYARIYEDGNYILSGSPGSSFKLRANRSRSGESSVEYFDVGESVIIPLKKGDYLTVYIQIDANVTGTNIVYYPMLRREGTDAEYERPNIEMREQAGYSNSARVRFGQLIGDQFTSYEDDAPWSAGLIKTYDFYIILDTASPITSYNQLIANMLNGFISALKSSDNNTPLERKFLQASLGGGGYGKETLVLSNPNPYISTRWAADASFDMCYFIFPEEIVSAVRDEIDKWCGLNRHHVFVDVKKPSEFFKDADNSDENPWSRHGNRDMTLYAIGNELMITGDGPDWTY